MRRLGSGPSPVAAAGLCRFAVDRVPVASVSWVVSVVSFAISQLRRSRRCRGLAATEGLEGWSGHADTSPEIEAVTGRQGVEGHAADHERPMPADVPRVRLGGRAIDDGDAAPADDLENRIRADDAGRVLVDAETEQARVLGDNREQ